MLTNHLLSEYLTNKQYSRLLSIFCVAIRLPGIEQNQITITSSAAPDTRRNHNNNLTIQQFTFIRSTFTNRLLIYQHKRQALEPMKNVFGGSIV